MGFLTSRTTIRSSFATTAFVGARLITTRIRTGFHRYASDDNGGCGGGMGQADKRVFHECVTAAAEEVLVCPFTMSTTMCLNAKSVP